MQLILEKSGLLYLLALLSSHHLVMLNQAVLPLCLMYTLDPLPDNLILEVNSDVINKIVCILDIKQPLDGYKMVRYYLFIAVEMYIVDSDLVSWRQLILITKLTIRGWGGQLKSKPNLSLICTFIWKSLQTVFQTSFFGYKITF